MEIQEEEMEIREHDLTNQDYNPQKTDVLAGDLVIHGWLQAVSRTKCRKPRVSVGKS